MSNSMPDQEPIGVPTTIRTRRDGCIGTIILDRVDRRNACSRLMIQEIQQAFSDMHQEKSIRAVIITGAGDTFCAGTDLEELQQIALGDNAALQWIETTTEIGELFSVMLRFPKTIIASVNGAALGTGAGLVLAADIVVGAASATIGWPELQRGLVPNLTLPLLQFRVGAGLAAKCILTGEPLDAKTAQQSQIFHEVVPDHLVWARASEIGQSSAKAAPQAVQLSKQMLNESIGEHLFSLHSVGAAQSAAARTTEAASEGIQSFLQKRQPDWNQPQAWEAQS